MNELIAHRAPRRIAAVRGRSAVRRTEIAEKPGQKIYRRRKPSALPDGGRRTRKAGERRLRACTDNLTAQVRFMAGDQSNGKNGKSALRRTLEIAALVVPLLGFFGIANYADVFGPSSDARLGSPSASTSAPAVPIAPGLPSASGPPSAQAAVPGEIVGQWGGKGIQYEGDPYPQALEVVFTANGEYSKITEGAARDEGLFVVQARTVTFRPANGSSYTWSLDITQFAGRPVLVLDNGIRTYELARIG